MTRFTVANTTLMGHPCRVYDADGNEIQYPLVCDTETGHVVQYIFDANNNPSRVFNVYPAPLRVEYISTSERPTPMAIDKRPWEELKFADQVPDEMRRENQIAHTVGQLIEILQKLPHEMPVDVGYAAAVGVSVIRCGHPFGDYLCCGLEPLDEVDEEEDEE